MIERWRRWRYDCSRCNDSGMEPGYRGDRVVVSPRPCPECLLGKANNDNLSAAIRRSLLDEEPKGEK